MSSEQLVRRSLGVPDVVKTAHASEAITSRLASAAGLDVTQDPNVSYESQRRLADAARVAARAVLDAG